MNYIKQMVKFYDAYLHVCINPLKKINQDVQLQLFNTLNLKNHH